ncbi:hypothetical protein GCM10020218_086730 [Dactylosporangium vinaceum]
MAENIELPLRMARAAPDPAWLAHVVARVGLGERLRCTGRPSCPAASSSGWRSPGPGEPARRGLLRPSRPARWTTTTAADVLALLRAIVDEHGQTVVMVTHDPVAASYADRVVVLADGRIVRDVPQPGVSAGSPRCSPPSTAAPRPWRAERCAAWLCACCATPRDRDRDAARA